MSSKYTSIIRKAYEGFNNRKVEHVLALMEQDVHWPKAFEGGHVKGQIEVAAYWRKQWSEINPKVEPVMIIDREDGKVEVTVDQLVKDLGGNILFDGQTVHVFTFKDELIQRMDIS